MAAAARFSWKRHWPWVLVILGLALRRMPVAGGCFAAVLWIGSAVLVSQALAWAWRKLLFKVSRRLWVILTLMSVLPVAGLALLLCAVAWLGLGAQVSRSTQQTIQAWQEALRIANQEPTDAAALQALRSFGAAWVERVPALPPGVAPDFAGMVWADARDEHGLDGTGKDTFLRAVRKEAGGFRILSLNLGTLGERSQALSGGRVVFRLLPGKSFDKMRLQVRDASGEDRELPAADESAKPLATWTKGQPIAGGGLFKPFRLPPLAFQTLDWSTGRDLVIIATPETNLVALFKGYATTKDQMLAEGTVKAIMVVILILLAMALSQFLSGLLGLRLAWSLGRSVDDLHKGVDLLAKGDFSARIRPRSRDQIGVLARSFNEMARQLEASLHEHEAKLALEEELKIAREVQMRLLPDLANLRLPAAVTATLLPAKEVAGDYYDLFRLADGRVAFLVADVSGKGTSAAFYAAETKGVLAALDKAALGPREIAARINEIWCSNHGRRIFLTLAYGTFDPRSGAFAFVRCGHPPAILRRADGRVERLAPAGLGIGMTDHGFMERVELCEGTLAPGDALVIFTDGLTEAMDVQDQLYGQDRLEALLKLPVDDPRGNILADVLRFAEGRGLSDDLTLLVLGR
ncbi:MAG TPA: SpoIIE family protein phosphatase [Holophagaceae bacterium]|nr:SpoIIE family protein phosphatase [Holophagaceae bacterium]